MEGELKNKGIYLILNLVNRKYYIGSTIVSFKQRFRDHKRKLTQNKHGNVHLQSAWNKYGADLFEFIILEIIDNIQDIRKKEKLYIDLYHACDRELGYNINSETEFNYIELSTREKLSLYMKNAWKKGIYTSSMYKGRIPWNKSKKCTNISKTKREIAPSIEVYKEDVLICTFRSATDLDEWSKCNILPGMTFSVDKHKRTVLGKFTSHIRSSNIQRAIRNKAKYRGLYFKRVLPLPSEMGVVKWENCWNGENPNQQPSQPLTKLEGSETNS